ncbi:MAG: Mur ligase family protein [Bacteroidota bacterium]
MDLASLYQEYLKTGQKVSTDSRRIEPDCLFFALKGPNFNGNQYAADALAKGAAFAIIDDPTFDKGSQYVVVEDVLRTLQNLARHHRRQFQIPVIGITGSNGKTTTKELVAHVFKTHYRTHFTQGNFNNHIGVPLTLLAMPLDTEIAIVEMGANHQGEIAQLCEIAEPSHGLITNIGKAHLEGFGGIEGVKKGKSELYRYLANQRGIAFVNRDEKFLPNLSEDVLKRIFYFESQHPTVDEPGYETVLLQQNPFLEIGFMIKLVC